MIAATPSSPATAGLLRLQRLARSEDGERLPLLLWSAGPGWRMISNAVLGGGIGERAWVINAQVAHGYRRTDPDRHLAALAGEPLPRDKWLSVIIWLAIPGQWKTGSRASEVGLLVLHAVGPAPEGPDGLLRVGAEYARTLRTVRRHRDHAPSPSLRACASSAATTSSVPFSRPAQRAWPPPRRCCRCRAR